MEDVVPGEGGEPMTGDSGIDTGQTFGVTTFPDYDFGSSEVGTTGGVHTLQLEIDILSTMAIDRVAQEIARRVEVKASQAKIHSITVASPAVIAALRLHSALEAEVSTLEAMTERLSTTTRSDLGAGEVSDTTALVIPVIGTAVEGVRQAVSSAAAALRSFAVTTSYSGRSKLARQVLLDAALAKHLSLVDLEVEVPQHALPMREPGRLVARILKLQARCRQLQGLGAGGVDYGPILESVDSLVSILFGRSDSREAMAPVAEQLILADGVARAVGKGKALLFAEIVFSGGSYRTRRWIFNFLLGQDGLTYNGGAGVTFFLFRADEPAALDSDTIYLALPHGRFRRDAAATLQSTNISG